MMLVNQNNSRNRTQITNSPNSSLQITNSEVFLQNVPNGRVAGDHNQVYLLNCPNAVVEGFNNDVHGTNMPNGKVNGEHNTIAANRTYNLEVAGSQNICELADEANPKILGRDNRVRASGNANFHVFGNGNFVLADKNTNLQIQSDCSGSKIVVSHSRNITIEGENNQISVRNTKISHCLKTNNGYIGRDGLSHVQFSGSQLQFNVSSPPVQPPQALQNPPEVDPNAGMWSCQGETYVPVELPLGNSPPSTGLTPHLKITYDKQLSINNMDYVIGILNFKLVLLRKPSDSGYVSLLGIQVDVSELGESFCAMRGRDDGQGYIYLRGKKDGITEAVALRAPRIIKCNNQNEFIIDLNPDSANVEA